jgi:hypothetical protein
LNNFKNRLAFLDDTDEERYAVTSTAWVDGDCQKKVTFRDSVAYKLRQLLSEETFSRITIGMIDTCESIGCQKRGEPLLYSYFLYIFNYLFSLGFVFGSLIEPDKISLYVDLTHPLMWAHNDNVQDILRCYTKGQLLRESLACPSCGSRLQSKISVAYAPDLLVVKLCPPWAPYYLRPAEINKEVYFGSFPYHLAYITYKDSNGVFENLFVWNKVRIEKNIADTAEVLFYRRS